MEMIFSFLMLSDENDAFVRRYEVPYDMTFDAFHRFICNDLGFDPGQMASFFFSDKEWAKLQEFTLVDMGADNGQGPLSMASVTLGQVIRNNKDRLVYVFDTLLDRALYLELVEAKKADAADEYPRVTLSEGSAPDQFDETAGTSGSIFDEAMDDFSDFGGSDAYDDQY